MAKAIRSQPAFPMPCGHEAWYAVNADEGTGWCSRCELEASRIAHSNALQEIDALHIQIEALVSKIQKMTPCTS